MESNIYKTKLIFDDPLSNLVLNLHNEMTKSPDSICVDHVKELQKCIEENKHVAPRRTVQNAYQVKTIEMLQFCSCIIDFKKFCAKQHTKNFKTFNLITPQLDTQPPFERPVELSLSGRLNAYKSRIVNIADVSNMISKSFIKSIINIKVMEEASNSKINITNLVIVHGQVIRFQENSIVILPHTYKALQAEKLKNVAIIVSKIESSLYMGSSENIFVVVLSTQQARLENVRSCNIIINSRSAPILENSSEISASKIGLKDDKNSGGQIEIVDFDWAHRSEVSPNWTKLPESIVSEFAKTSFIETTDSLQKQWLLDQQTQICKQICTMLPKPLNYENFQL